MKELVVNSPLNDNQIRIDLDHLDEDMPVIDEDELLNTNLDNAKKLSQMSRKSRTIKSVQKMQND